MRVCVCVGGSENFRYFCLVTWKKVFRVFGSSRKMAKTLAHCPKLHCALELPLATSSVHCQLLLQQIFSNTHTHTQTYQLYIYLFSSYSFLFLLPLFDSQKVVAFATLKCGVAYGCAFALGGQRILVIS